MSVTLNAAACPAVQTPADAPLLADAYDPEGTTACAKTVAPGDTVISSPWNQNALRLDLMARYGGGGRGIVRGLGISAAALVATVAAGHALIDGIVEIAETTQALADDEDNYLWLRRTGAIVVQVGTTAAPATDAVYLGMIRTVAGSPTLTDTSGVVHLRGGMLWRQTADAGEPGDTPPASLALLTRTAGGLYLWDGVDWAPIG